jgi:hypothetical protein
VLHKKNTLQGTLQEQQHNKCISWKLFVAFFAILPFQSAVLTSIPYHSLIGAESVYFIFFISFSHSSRQHFGLEKLHCLFSAPYHANQATNQRRDVQRSSDVSVLTIGQQC